MNWLERAIEYLSPSWSARRLRARLAVDLVQRHYEAAGSGRRTSGWRATSSDPNAALGTSGGRLRDVARDLARNNSFAASALLTIVNNTVGYGIVAKPDKRLPQAAVDRWKRWAETTACDADGRLDLAGLEKLVVRTVAESGECLVRRRWRRPEDNLPIPLQLQVLEPDYLDTTKDGLGLGPDAIRGKILQGIEFDPIGRRRGYWMFSEHPGASFLGSGTMFGLSQFVPAEEILHIYRQERPGQVRGVSWFAPVTLRMKDFDDYEDATLMKQKVAACLAALVTDIDGTSTGLGTVDTTATDVDQLYPGMIGYLPAGKGVEIVQPPSVSEHDGYAKTILRAIAAGLGITFEDLTGSYEGLPFSAARMSRLRAWQHIDDWRWRMLIPQFCDPIWRWAMQGIKASVTAADVAALVTTDLERLPVEWTCPPAPMIDPQAEMLAYERGIRNGLITLPEAQRERGYDSDAQLEEIAATNKKLDRLGIVLDCDPRRITQAGQTQSVPATTPAAGEPAMNGNGRRP